MTRWKLSPKPTPVRSAGVVWSWQAVALGAVILASIMDNQMVDMQVDQGERHIVEFDVEASYAVRVTVQVFGRT